MPHVGECQVEIPAGVDPSQLRDKMLRHLERKFGVQIERFSTSPAAGARAETIRLFANATSSEYALEIARDGVQEFLLHPADEVAALSSLEKDKCFVFVDHSNIMPGGKRISCQKLHEMVVGPRQARDRVLVGSCSRSGGGEQAAFQQWKELGYKVHSCVRPVGMGEQFVDDVLVAQMQEVLLRHVDLNAADNVLVLLSEMAMKTLAEHPSKMSSRQQSSTAGGVLRCGAGALRARRCTAACRPCQTRSLCTSSTNFATSSLSETPPLVGLFSRPEITWRKDPGEGTWSRASM